MKAEPLVSIVCEVYNHGKYLRDCLEGFVRQQTSFPIEILVHDDASTDDSAEIIREYAAKYPDLFRPLLQQENQYSKGLSIWKTYQFPRARGKYLALCEGDDYWTDPHKLQKQVDFLEAHPDYGLVHTGFQELRQSSGTFVPVRRRRNIDGEATADLILMRSFISTPTVCFRASLLEKIDESFRREQFLMGDYPLWIELSRFGKFKFMPEVMVTYRVLDNSASHSTDRAKAYGFSRNSRVISQYFARKYGDSAMLRRVTKEVYFWESLVCLARKEYGGCLRCIVRAFPLPVWRFRIYFKTLFA